MQWKLDPTEEEVVEVMEEYLDSLDSNKCLGCGAPDLCYDDCSVLFEEVVEQAALEAECEEHGCIINGHSSIGPDSGTEWLNCIHCGYSETINWY